MLKDLLVILVRIEAFYQSIGPRFDNHVLQRPCKDISYIFIYRCTQIESCTRGDLVQSFFFPNAYRRVPVYSWGSGGSGPGPVFASCASCRHRVVVVVSSLWVRARPHMRGSNVYC